jgi:capsular exopolysaccharide synthesis family protein
MSYIFEAIQKAAAEEVNNESRSSLPLGNLMQVIRQKAAEEPVTDNSAQHGFEHAPAVVEHSAALSQVQSVPQLSVSLTSEPAGVAIPKPAPVPSDVPIDQFNRFRSVQVIIPSESRIVSLTDKQSLAAEKFQNLAVRLRAFQYTRPLKKVLVTSTIPQEGKSTVAANLACALARRPQQKILLLDGDLRRPTVAMRFGLGDAPGISEWLQSDGEPISNIYQLEDTRLWILPAGSTPKNPLELIQSRRLSRLMEQLTAWFDWIVIDSPPVLPLADTSIWMRLADGVLLVVRKGVSQTKLLSKGIKAIESSKVLGAILNGSTNTTLSDYYYQPVAKSSAISQG